MAFAGAALLGGVLAGCGGADETAVGADATLADSAQTTVAADAASDPTMEPEGPSVPVADRQLVDVPDVAVTDISSGFSVDLVDYIAEDRPTLLWMWAPH